MITDDFGLDTKLYRLNFMHLTMQEFMAAFLVASWAPEEQAAFWRKHFVLQYNGYIVSEDRFLTMFSLYCGLTGLQYKGVQDYLLEEVDNVWILSDQSGQTFIRIAIASGNNEFACRVLSPLGKKLEVDLFNTLDSAYIAWCLRTCKDSFEELVVTYHFNLVHAVAHFLGQLGELTSISVLQLPDMICYAKHSSESTCSKGTLVVHVHL